jgi:hypothetical protein
VTVKPSNPDPLVQIENAQKILAKAGAPLAQLEAAKVEVELEHVLAGAAAELEEIGARRTIETSALMPAAALDKALDRLDLIEKAIGRASKSRTPFSLSLLPRSTSRSRRRAWRSGRPSTMRPKNL